MDDESGFGVGGGAGVGDAEAAVGVDLVEVGDAAGVEGVGPIGIGGGGGGDAEEFLAQGEAGGGGVGVVDAVAGLDGVPVGFEAGEGVGDAAVAFGTGLLGLAVDEEAEGAAGGDAGEEAGGGGVAGGVEEAGFVVEGHGGEPGAAGGEVEHGGVAGEGLVAEGAVEHVGVADAFEALGDAVAGHRAVEEDAFAFGFEGLGALHRGVHGGEARLHLADERELVGHVGEEGDGGVLEFAEVGVFGDFGFEVDDVVFLDGVVGVAGVFEGEVGEFGDAPDDGGGGAGGGFGDVGLGSAGDGGDDFREAFAEFFGAFLGGVGDEVGDLGEEFHRDFDVVDEFALVGDGFVGFGAGEGDGGVGLEEGELVAEAGLAVFEFGLGREEGVVGLDEVAEGGLDFALRAAAAGPGGWLDLQAEGVEGALDDDAGAGGEGGVRDPVGDIGGGLFVELHVVVGGEVGAGDGEDADGGGDGDAGDGGIAEGFEVEDHVVDEVGSVVALGVGAGDADVVGVGVAVDLDEAVLEGDLFLLRGGDGLGGGVVLLAERGGGFLGGGEGGLGALEGGEGAVVDLLEVALAGVESGGGEVERDRVFVESQRVQPGVGAVKARLDVGEGGGDLADGGGVGAVDDVEARGGRVVFAADLQQVRHGVEEEGVGDGPVEVGALAGAGGPAVDVPAAVGVGVGGPAFEAARAEGVVAAGGEADDVGAGAGLGGGGGGEGFFVEVVDADGGVADEGGAGDGVPAEVGVGEEGVVGGEGGEVVAPGVAVALRVHALGVGGADLAGGVGGVAANGVVAGVGDLAAVDAVGVVPDEAVVDGGDGDGRLGGVVAAAQEGELFLQEARDLVLEAEERGVERGVAVVPAGGAGAGVDGDGGVHGVGVGLVAERHVELVEARGGEEEGVVAVGVGDAGLEGEREGAVHDGLVDLDQPRAVHGVGFERHGALVGRAALLDDGLGEAGGVFGHVGEALVVGVEGGHDALDPAGCEGGDPGAPVGGGGAEAVGAAVADGEVVVGEHEEGALGGAALDGDGGGAVAAAGGAGGEVGLPGLLRGAGDVPGDGDAPAPLEFVVGGLAAEVVGVDEGEFFFEGVAGLDDVEVLGAPEVGRHADDLEADGQAGGDAAGVGAVVEGEGDVAAGVAVGGRGAGEGGVDVGGVGGDGGGGVHGQGVHGGLPGGLGGGGEAVAEGAQAGLFVLRQPVRQDVGGAGERGAEHAGEDELAVGAARGVVVEALFEGGRDVPEAVARAGRLLARLAGRREGVDDGLGEVLDLLGGGVVEDDARPGGVRLGLLVDDVHAGLVPDVRQPAGGFGQGLGDGHRGDVGGPFDVVGDVQRRAAGPAGLVFDRQPGQLLADLRLGGEFGEAEAVLHAVIEVHDDVGRLAVVAGGLGPPVVLAVLPAGSAGAGGVEAALPGGEGHRGGDGGAGLGGVAEGVGFVGADDVEDGHRGGAVGLAGVEQHVGFAGAAGGVEVVAQGVGGVAEDHGVFFVGVVAGAVPVVLDVDGRRGEGGAAAALAGGDDDFRRVGGPRALVVEGEGGVVEREGQLAVELRRPAPPDFEGVGVDREEGRLRVRLPRLRVVVGVDVVGGAGVDEARERREVLQVLVVGEVEGGDPLRAAVDRPVGAVHHVVDVRAGALVERIGLEQVLLGAAQVDPHQRTDFVAGARDVPVAHLVDAAAEVLARLEGAADLDVARLAVAVHRPEGAVGGGRRAVHVEDQRVGGAHAGQVVPRAAAAVRHGGFDAPRGGLEIGVAVAGVAHFPGVGRLVVGVAVVAHHGVGGPVLAGAPGPGLDGERLLVEVERVARALGVAPVAVEVHDVAFVAEGQDFLADGPADGGGVELRRVVVAHAAEGFQPEVVGRGVPHQRQPRRGEGQPAGPGVDRRVGGLLLGGLLGGLARDFRPHAVGQQRLRRAGAAGVERDADGVRGPLDFVPVHLERPGHAARVLVLPVDLRVPGRALGGAEGEEPVALSGVGAVFVHQEHLVRGAAADAGGDLRHQVVRPVVAVHGQEAVAHLRRHALHRRGEHLHRLHAQRLGELAVLKVFQQQNTLHAVRAQALRAVVDVDPHAIRVVRGGDRVRPRRVVVGDDGPDGRRHVVVVVERRVDLLVVRAQVDRGGVVGGLGPVDAGGAVRRHGGDRVDHVLVEPRPADFQLAAGGRDQLVARGQPDRAAALVPPVRLLVVPHPDGRKTLRLPAARRAVGRRDHVAQRVLRDRRLQRLAVGEERHRQRALALAVRERDILRFAGRRVRPAVRRRTAGEGHQPRAARVVIRLRVRRLVGEPPHPEPRRQLRRRALPARRPRARQHRRRPNRQTAFPFHLMLLACKMGSHSARPRGSSPSPPNSPNSS